MRSEPLKTSFNGMFMCHTEKESKKKTNAFFLYHIK